jgi:DnaK suppressor protein
MRATRRSITGPDDTLTTDRIDKIREELRGELAQLKRNLAEVWPCEVLAARESRHVSVDHAQSERLASDLYDRLQERRTEILGALDRIQQGSYGRCAICGGPIPYRRLEVVPETYTCIGCCC